MPLGDKVVKLLKAMFNRLDSVYKWLYAWPSLSLLANEQTLRSIGREFTRIDTKHFVCHAGSADRIEK